MEIMYRGIHPDDIEYVGICVECLTRVRFARKEAVHDNGGNAPTLKVECPVCEATIATSTKYVIPQGNYMDR